MRRSTVLLALCGALSACTSKAPVAFDAGASDAGTRLRFGAGVRAGPATEGTLQDLAAQLPAANPATAPTDPGQALSLNDTAFHTFSSAAATIGCYVSAPLANTAAADCAFATSVTTSTGVELQPGDREFFPVSNANKISCITGTATQALHAACL